MTLSRRTTLSHYTEQLHIARQDPSVPGEHYRRILDQIRCTAVKVTFEHGTMRCSRPVGHVNSHHDAMSGNEWS